jgi:hypothetical protein
LINSGKAILLGAASAAGGVLFAAGGIYLGLSFSGPVGGLIGFLIGGMTGPVLASLGVQYIIEKIDNIYQEYTA